MHVRMPWRFRCYLPATSRTTGNGRKRLEHWTLSRGRRRVSDLARSASSARQWYPSISCENDLLKFSSKSHGTFISFIPRHNFRIHHQSSINYWMTGLRRADAFEIKWEYEEGIPSQIKYQLQLGISWSNLRRFMRDVPLQIYRGCFCPSSMCLECPLARVIRQFLANFSIAGNVSLT